MVVLYRLFGDIMTMRRQRRRLFVPYSQGTILWCFEEGKDEKNDSDRKQDAKRENRKQQ